MDVPILNLPDYKDSLSENSLLHETDAISPDSTPAGSAEYPHDDTVSNLNGRYYVDLGVMFERLTFLGTSRPEPMSTLSSFDILMDSVGSLDEPGALLMSPSHVTSESLSYPEPASVDDFLFEVRPFWLGALAFTYFVPLTA